MAGKKRAGRPGYKAKNERYKTYNVRGKNKRLKAVRHKLKVEKQKELSAKRNQTLQTLIGHCHDEFKLGNTVGKAKYLLKRIVGTLTEKKLKGLLSGDLQGTLWFQERRLTSSLKAMLKITKFPHSLCELMTG